MGGLFRNIGLVLELNRFLKLYKKQSIFGSI